MSQIVRSKVEVEAIRQELGRVLASPMFRSAQRSQAFLRHIVESSLRGHAPKEYEIAVDVLERKTDYDPAVDATVRVEAGRLRSRLREYYQTAGDEAHSILIDIPKGGYTAVFTHREAEAPATRSLLTVGEFGTVQAGDSSGKAASQIPDNTWSAKRRVAVAAIAVIAGLVLWVSAKQFLVPPPIRSVAVLPLQNFSGDPNEEYFADGMTDELITELARIPGLRVVSRTSIMQEKGTKESLVQIAHELEVDAIVEGSVMRSGERVRITAQLIDGRSDRHLWAQSFEAQLSDVLSLQDDVARQIASETKAVLTPALQTQFANAKHINPEAHDAYLRGLYFTGRRDGDLAVKYFGDAIKLDPMYASGYAGLAEALLTKSEVAGTHLADVIPSAIAAAKRAIELDPQDGEAYTALGAIETDYLWDWKAADRDLRRGLTLSPNSALAEIRYVIFLDDVDRPDEALIHMRHAVELDPLSFWANRHLGTALFFDRKFAEALAALDRSAEIAPDKPDLVAGWKYAVFEAQGKYDQAVAEELRATAEDKFPSETNLLRSAYERGGWSEYQEARIRLLLPRPGDHCSSDDIGLAYLRLGKLNDAFLWFNREADEHCFWVLTLKADPRFDKVRNDQRYLALLRRINLVD